MKKILLKFVLPVFLMPSIVFATHNEPLSVVQAWGKAVKERDGKKQYQLLCPDQQKKNRATLEAADGRLLVHLNKSFVDSLSALGFDPVSRTRLGVAEVKRVSALDELLAKRQAKQN